MTITLTDITTSKESPPRLLIYGDGGLGKTTFAASAPNPIFIRTEDGMGKLTNIPCFPVAKNYNDVWEALHALIKEDHEFKTVILDSCDWLAPHVQNYMIENFEKNDLAYGKDKNILLSCWERILKRFDYLRLNKKMNVIFICHQEKQTIDCPRFGSYSNYQLKLPENVSKKIKEWVDVGMYMSRVINITESVGGFGKKTIRAVGGEMVTAHFNPEAAFWAKNRNDITDSMIVPKENGWAKLAEKL